MITNSHTIPIYRHASSLYKHATSLFNKGFKLPPQISHRWKSEAIVSPPPRDTLSSRDAGAPPVSIRRMTNGATLVLQKMPACRNTATVGVWLKFGSRLPDDDSEGLVHFMEHMTFKGTKWRDAKDIEKYIENHGGHLNAYTSKDHVAYFANCLSVDAASMLCLTLEMLQHSALKESAVDEEINTILRESFEVNLIPEEVLFDKIHEHVFSELHPLGQPILGSDLAIKNVTRKKLVALMKKYYTPDNMVIIATGDIDEDALVSVVDRLEKGEGCESHNFSSEETAQFEGGYRLFVQQVEDAYVDSPSLLVARTVEGVSWDSADFPLSIVTRAMLSDTLLLGTDENSRPMTMQGSRPRVPTTLVPVWETNTPVVFDAYYRDTGLFGTYQLVEMPRLYADHRSWADVEPEILYNAIQTSAQTAVEETTQKWTERVEKWTDEELRRAKEATLVVFAATTDSSNAVAEEIGRQILAVDTVEDFESVKRDILSLSLSDVKAFVREKILDPKKVAITALLRVPPLTAD